MSPEYEITKFRMLSVKDSLGHARVWAFESDHDHPERPWSVMHRPNDGAFPVMIEGARSFDDALRIARALVVAYSPPVQEEP